MTTNRKGILSNVIPNIREPANCYEFILGILATQDTWRCLGFERSYLQIVWWRWKH